jgi:hypothetical protein
MWDLLQGLGTDAADADLAVADPLDSDEHAERGRRTAPGRSDEDHELAAVECRVHLAFASVATAASASKRRR